MRVDLELFKQLKILIMSHIVMKSLDSTKRKILTQPASQSS